MKTIPQLLAVPALIGSLLFALASCDRDRTPTTTDPIPTDPTAAPPATTPAQPRTEGDTIPVPEAELTEPEEPMPQGTAPEPGQ